MRKLFLLTLIFSGLGLSSSLQAQAYTLSVEEHAVDMIPGQTTYRVYVGLVNETDFLSSVYGGEETPLSISTTTGFYNSAFGGTTAAAINPLFFSAFPEVEYDSWLTIGIDSQPEVDETDVSTLESSGQPYLSCFAANNPLSGSDVSINDETGGAWYVLNGSPNGLPNEDMRVLILQITTGGELCGLINAQIFENGLGATPLYLTFDFCGPGVYNPASGEPIGCTDELACNYDPDATEDDGSCTYAEANYDCDGTCLNDNDNDGICDELETAGCTDSFACNFNAEATDDDGSCEYLSCSGCTDASACNYDPDALYNDGSCDYVSCAVTGCTNVNACNFNPEATTDDGSCEYSTCVGCTDETACNYDLDATQDNGSCNYPVSGLDCEGNCVNDSDQDGICDENEIPGCTDVTASNYDANATDDDGSCVMPTEALDLVGVIDFTVPEGGAAGKAIHLVALADISDLSIFAIGVANNGGGTDGEEYTLCAESASAGDDILIVRDAAAMESYFSYCFSEFELVCEGTNAISQNGDDAIELFEMGVVIETFGDPNVDGSGEAWEYSDSWAYQNTDGEWTYGGVDCTDDTDNIYDTNCLYPICSPLTLGCTDEMACNFDVQADTNDGSCEYPALGYDCSGNCIEDADGDGICNDFEVAGCSDMMACNYDELATDDDGSCTYAEAGYDCAGNCLNDSDGDGICNDFEVAGCNDMMACNYDESATDDDGSCTYAEAGYDCAGNCLEDTDGDGICNDFEVAGCSDMMACNYDESATDDDGSCTYAEAGYDCAGNCLNDSDGDGICDEFELGGCTDIDACNYDELATDDDGSCNYPETGYDCDGNCLNDSDGDGICDEFEIAGCTDEEAENYNEEATDDDGSCFYCDFTIVISVIDDVNSSNNGSIDVTISGGSGVYDFTWDGPDSFESTDEDISGLAGGTYSWTVTDSNGCTASIDVEVGDLVDDIQEFDVSFALVAYPNPASNTLTLESDDLIGKAQIQLFDGTGRLISDNEHTSVNGRIQLNVSDLATGTYSLIAVSNGRRAIERIQIR
ncbi:MAG: hypothetical protein CL834_03865 [Crocinitomicaceae bacterium]|nr:hypothetical protein [Crocinitomicaceae bacterium]